MKNLRIILSILGIISVALLPALLQSKSRAAEQTVSAAYEYASFSSMGNNSSIIWPDGTVLKLADQYKRPQTANEKMYCMTMALNLLEQKGYSVYSTDTTPMFMNVGHENDLIFRKRVTK